jgi:hypothetical protein
MKRAASRLITIPFVLAALGPSAAICAGCAVGSAASDADGGVSGPPTGLDAGSSDAPDVGPVPDANADAGQSDASPRDDAGADSGDASDASNDAGADADAGPRVTFGATCSAGTTYTEPFTSDPVASGTFLPLIGPYSYSASSKTISLTSGSPNTQLWIGARPSWTSYTIRVPVRIDSAGGNGGINFRMVSTPASPANNAGQMYFAGIATDQALLGVENNTNGTAFAGPSATFAVGTFYTLQVTANGSSLSLSVDGTAYVTNYNDGTFTFGSFGLRTFSSGMTYGPITVTCN